MTCRTAVAAAEPPDDTPLAITVATGNSAGNSLTVVTHVGPGAALPAVTYGAGPAASYGTAGQRNDTAGPYDTAGQ